MTKAVRKPANIKNKPSPASKRPAKKAESNPRKKRTESALQKRGPAQVARAVSKKKTQPEQPKTAKRAVSAKEATPPSKKKPEKSKAVKAAPKPASGKSKAKAEERRGAVSKRTVRGRPFRLNADEVIKEFREFVNLTPGELERRLSTPESTKLGLRDRANAGIAGHESGRRILEILTKRRNQYTEDDLKHMQMVVGFVRKRRAERPPGDIFASNWRYSLMNWGHDPMRLRRSRRSK